jgi:hypothetical protein
MDVSLILYMQIYLTKQSAFTEIQRFTALHLAPLYVLRLLASSPFFLLFLVGWDWVSWYWGHYWPIATAPHDRWWWLRRNWWNEDWQGKPKYSEKTYPSAILSTTNPTWLDLGLPSILPSKPTEHGIMLSSPQPRKIYCSDYEVIHFIPAELCLQ